MKIYEFRVLLPMTVEEYQVAQLYSVAEASKVIRFRHTRPAAPHAAFRPGACVVFLGHDPGNLNRLAGWE